MAGILGVVGNVHSNERLENMLFDTIDPYGVGKRHKLSVDGTALFLVANLKKAPLHGAHYFKSDKWLAVFAGDLVEIPCHYPQHALPWRFIIKCLESNDKAQLAKLGGNYAIAALNKDTGKLYLISDRRSQYPIYYLCAGREFWFSSALTTFVKVGSTRFNPDWLYDFLFFNIPIGQTTFLKNAFRMKPATVLIYDLSSKKISLHTYAPSFSKRTPLLRGKEALEYALTVFKDRVPKYFEGDDVACSLTAGWDSRTLLAFAPEGKKITTYTYGVPGCSDLNDSAKTAQLLGVEHIKIYFDESFLEQAPRLLYDVIRFSSGAERVLRATLLYVYETLTKMGERFPVIVSGISGDHIFRGHGNVPSIISHNMDMLFRGNAEPDFEEFREILRRDYLADFRMCVNTRLEDLKQRFGELQLPEHHLSYFLYEIAPKYFGGELAIAGNFSTLRVPYWDDKIVDLAYSQEYSTLSFSKFCRKASNSRAENILYSYLMYKKAPLLARMPIYGKPPWVFLMGNVVYQLYRAIRKLGTLPLGRKKTAPLEDWNKWLNDLLKNNIEELLLSKNTILGEYIERNFISQTIAKRDAHWLGKMATVEIILRLIANRWDYDIGSLY